MQTHSIAYCHETNSQPLKLLQNTILEPTLQATEIYDLAKIISSLSLLHEAIIKHI